jgi:3-oxoacyl-(acyl-carrier-protein) synthase III
MVQVRVAGVSAYFPPNERTSHQVEELIRTHSPGLQVPHGIIESVTGIRTRRVAAEDVNSSDLAAEAGKKVLEKTNTSPDEVDLLIFASVCQDLAEPATANIVQEKVGTSCPVFDLKNACNSFLNALQVAEALIQSGAYRTVLVTVGETITRSIRWSVPDRQSFKRSFLGYTLGDAGAAALVVASADETGIFHRSFRTVSRYWDTLTVLGGGSMHPRGDEYTYFEGEGNQLKEAFSEIGPDLIFDALAVTETSFMDYQRVFVHQVSMPILDSFLEATNLPREKVFVTVQQFGNLGSASMPVGFALAEEQGEIGPGDRVMWIGLASGASVGVVLMQL